MHFGYMFRVNIDGRNEQALNLRGNSMIVYCDRIYFLKHDVSFFLTPTGLLHSVNLDGSNLQRLTREDSPYLSREFAGFMNIANGQMFFPEAWSSQALYKINLDGSYRQMLLDYYRISSIIILGDKLFVFDIASRPRQLLIMNLDGSNKRRLE